MRQSEVLDKSKRNDSSNQVQCSDQDKAGAYDLIQRIINQLSITKKATIPDSAVIPSILTSLKSFELQAVLLELVPIY